MSKKSLIEFHRKNWYNTAGLAYEDIAPHLENFKRLDETIPPSPRFYLVANFNTYQYDYVGKGQFLLTGYDNELVAREGMKFQVENIHPEDAEHIVKEVYPHFQEILSSYPFEEQKNILFQNNYRFRHKNGHYVHLMEQIGVMKADEKGNHQLMLVHIYELPMVHPFSIHTLVKKLLPDKTYQTLYSKEYPEPKIEVSLSPREKEVMSLLAEGMNSEEIGKKLFISLHTVRTHRKNMLHKLEAKSTNELVAYGITRGIIK